MSAYIIKFISTFLGIGYIKKAPGTAGSLAGLLIWFLIRGNIWVYLGVTVTILTLGFWVSDKAQKAFGKKDDQRIVIDEVAGMLIALCNVKYYLGPIFFVFIAFRGFDIVKPYPINKAQQLKGSLGIMLDDILAAVYVQIIYNFLLEIVKLSHTKFAGLFA